MTVDSMAPKRKIVGRLVFSFFLLSLIFRFLINATPSRFLEPVLFEYSFDFTYWLLKLSGISDLIITSKGGILFDISIFIACILCILFPLKNIFAIIFGTLFLIYAVLYNTYIVHHAHPLTVMTVVTIPFFFRDNIKWNFLWEAMRYYVCFLYFISFIWKAFIGKSLFYWNMGVNSTKLNLVEYLYHYPNTALSNVYKFLISNPAILNTGLIFIFLLEGIMVIGFFTKRFDRFLLFIPIIIHLTTYIFADVFFLEMLVGVFTFLSPKAIQKLRFTTTGT